MAIGCVLTGCSKKDTRNEELASAPDLDVEEAPIKSYNCYGNAIGKQKLANPSGYKNGDTAEMVLEYVKKDLGEENVRGPLALTDPIGDDEYLVALKCNEIDYHFIRRDQLGWYNKPSKYLGYYVPESFVDSELWLIKIYDEGEIYRTTVAYYGTTIYFAVKIGWDD